MAFDMICPTYRHKAEAIERALQRLHGREEQRGAAEAALVVKAAGANATDLIASAGRDEMK